MTETELAQAANSIYGLLVGPSLSLNELLRAAAIGCQTLESLAEDQIFLTTVGFLHQLQLKNQAGFYEITGATTHTLNYFRYFLNLEKQLLLSGGLRLELVEGLIGQAERLVEDIRLGTRDASYLQGTLYALRQKTCDLARNLRAIQEGQEQSLKKRARLLSIAYGVGGACLIVINASSPAFGDINLGDAGKAVSGAIGGVILEKAWDLLA